MSRDDLDTAPDLSDKKVRDALAEFWYPAEPGDPDFPQSAVSGLFDKLDTMQKLVEEISDGLFGEAFRKYVSINVFLALREMIENTRCYVSHTEEGEIYFDLSYQINEAWLAEFPGLAKELPDQPLAEKLLDACDPYTSVEDIDRMFAVTLDQVHRLMKERGLPASRPPRVL